MNRFSILLFFFFFSVVVKAQFQTILLPLATTEDLKNISFINDSTYYICSSGFVSKTFNNGTSWQSVSGSIFTAQTAGVLDLHFYNSNSGFITGAYNFLNDEIVLSTTNGGSSWNPAYINSSMPVPRYFRGADVNGSNAVICGANGDIIKSINNGLSWSAVNSTVTLELFDIKYLSSSDILCVGENRILRSSNGGNTWAVDTGNHTGAYYNCISSPGDSVVFVSEETNQLLRSFDNGATFIKMNTPFTNIRCVAAKNADTVFVGTTSGLYVSFNRGVNWHQFKDTKNYFINRLAIRKNKVYAMCNSRTLLILDIYNMTPEPIAKFNISINSQCGVSTLIANNNSDSSYSFQWFLNGLPVANSYNYSVNYYSAASNQTVKLVATNSNGTDTAIVTTDVSFRVPVSADAGPDIYQCYGQESWITALSTSQYYNWQPASVFNTNGAQAVRTKNLTSDTQIILKAYNSDNCIDYDTLMIYLGNPLSENYFSSNPGIPNNCTNASCAWISDLEFVTDSIGFGIANTGDFIKTTDAGMTWTRVNLGSGNDEARIDFLDKNIGYTTGPARKTIDGGQTFTPLLLDYYFVRGVSYINKDTGVYYKLGPLGNMFNGSIYKTIDGGNNFTQIYSHTTDGNIYFTDIKMLNDTVIYACGGVLSQYSSPRIKKTTNGGITWTTIIPPVTGGIHEMAVISKDTLFCISSNDYVLRTYDGGVTWETYMLQYAPSAYKHSITMLNSSVGYAAGHLGDVFKTTNGGDCWTKVATLPYPEPHAIASSPSKKSIYVSIADEFSQRPPVVYHTRHYRELYAFVDTSLCVGTFLNTHNRSFGYSKYKWYINGAHYSSSYDTSIVFSTTGNHVLKLVADSASVLDSISFNLTINSAPTGMGQITGDSILCTNTALVPGGNSLTFTVTSTPNLTSYHWFVNNGLFVLNTLSSTSGTQNIVFANSDTVVTIYATGLNTSGCISSDTASFKIKTLNAVSPTPTSLTLSPTCARLDLDSYLQTLDWGYIYCVTDSTPNSIEYHFREATTGDHFTTKHFFNMPIFDICSNTTYTVMVRSSNLCGYSDTSANAYFRVYFDPDTLIYTHDTIVNYLTPAKLRMEVKFDSLLWPYSCIYADYEWYHNNLFYAPQGDLLFSSVSPSDTGIYVARIINGCDTIEVPIRLSLFPYSATINDKYGDAEKYQIYPNPFSNDIIFLGPENVDVDIKVFDSLGQLVDYRKKINSNSMISFSHLSPGIYLFELWFDNYRYSKRMNVVKQ